MNRSVFNRRNGTGSIAMFVLALLLFLFSSPVIADDTINVLMTDSVNDALPSEKARIIQRVNGKALINGRVHIGSLSIVRDERGLYVVSTLPLEEYIEGVVASEIGEGWELEALKAQAVVSRSYALYHKAKSENNFFHLTSSVRHQVFKEHDNIDPLISFAVKETAGEVLTYGDTPIIAFFHATCEGKTELPEEIWGKSFPYLTSVECQTRNAPFRNWQRRFSTAEIEEALDIEGIEEITVASLTATGRVRSLLIRAENPSAAYWEVKATVLRQKLGFKDLPSTQFSVKPSGRDILFVGNGYGHGVGFSQWGALHMARQGKNYRDILAHFYPGTMLEKKEEFLTRTIPPGK